MSLHVLCHRKYVHPRNQTFKHETENTEEKHFGDTINDSNLEGKHDIVTFNKTPPSIIRNFHKHCNHLSEEEQKLISAAAKLIKSDIL
jgi:hypothetical protein